MLGIKVKKTKENLIIKWQLTKIEIPLDEIVEVTEDDTYAGAKDDAVRIGTPYGTTDRIVIKTKHREYILFTTNKNTILKQIDFNTN
ncbi:hypothetical protein BKP45_20995 [Anaerobacillus alkalidiazotrophicus]|uniref:Sublancin immunity protein SunI-like PH domain-containing protein n=1 Tax=Anaerobacillus alkalidiazotrophicus TaxID=472963 RepID=A0A1S2LYK0_9BACI|nr:hypothetical protein [Anaerobacillus alkalidiazotrophicus]OIJ16787.1 hypothetical protein BKP45_20995 [Anaerobacillus alkalidiazotrophicus]